MKEALIPDYSVRAFPLTLPPRLIALPCTCTLGHCNHLFLLVVVPPKSEQSLPKHKLGRHCVDGTKSIDGRSSISAVCNPTVSSTRKGESEGGGQ